MKRNSFFLLNVSKILKIRNLLIGVFKVSEYILSPSSLLPHVPKVMYDIATPPPIQDPICCVNFFYEYIQSCSHTDREYLYLGGQWFWKLFHFPFGIMVKRMNSPQKILIIMNEICKMYVFINFEKNTAYSSQISEKLRRCHFWSSTGSYVLFSHGSSLPSALPYVMILHLE